MAEQGPVVLKEESELDSLLKANPDFLSVVSFIASWSENCTATKELTRELLADPELSQVLFVELDAEEFPGLSKKYSVSSVPTIVFIRKENVVERLVGADSRNYVARVVALANDGSAVEGVPVKTVPKASAASAGDPAATAGLSLNDRLKQLVNQASVMVFMKGNPAQPRCGFSRQVIEILNATGVSYQTFDILEDEDVRQGLKKYSNWQTYPQIYVNGILAGGLDTIREMKDMGNLQDVLTGKEPL